MSFRNPLPRFGAPGEAVELHYDFAIDDSETVVYTGAGPFPGRVFVLRFWRHAKDGIMHLLGYRHQGHWRDPTICYPDSYVRYYRPQHPPGPRPPGDSPHQEPHDSTDHRRADSFAQMAYRVPLLEWEPGVWELPTLKGQPVHMIDNARRFPNPPKVILTRRKPVPPPPLGTPLQKTIEFVALSAHFQHTLRAEQELSGIVKVLKQFPRLHVTIQGNLANSFVPPTLLGFGAAARADQNLRFDTPAITQWPNGAESYLSNGQVMDSRARTIQQYLLRQGIDARRVTVQRGQYMTKRSVTIIFSN